MIHEPWVRCLSLSILATRFSGSLSEIVAITVGYGTPLPAAQYRSIPGPDFSISLMR